MKVTAEITDLYSFQAWSGAIHTKNKLLENGIDEEFIALAEEIFDGECTDTQLNDFLWFENQYIFEHFGLDENGEPLENKED